ncbi:MAG: phosphodiester glycosidase family protein [Actinobacteria bacterium]|nr:phosphodiester glycosidase family protein [Actinomycetota bacterium]
MSRARYTAAFAAAAIAIPLTVAAGGVAHAAPAPVVKSSVSPLSAPGVVRASWGGMSIVKISQSLNSFQFVPGTSAPGGYSSSYDSPSTYRNRMTAAFNGGFLLNSDAGGYALRGNIYKSLRSGYGSLVVDKSGHLNVIKWTSGMSASNYRVVRQNLPLLVDNGVNKTSSRGNGCDSWGAVGAQYRHCPGERSAVGVTSSGQVVYVYGYRVYANDLARALIHFGVKRGMVLEMNQAWPRAYTYSSPGGSASILNGNMSPIDTPCSAYKCGWVLGSDATP